MGQVPYFMGESIVLPIDLLIVRGMLLFYKEYFYYMEELYNLVN